MKEYQVQIKETFAMTVTVETESAARAREIVERQWKSVNLKENWRDTSNGHVKYLRL